MATPRTPQDRKAPAAKKAVSSLVEITRPETAEPEEREAIFSIDGVVYTVPTKVPATLTLRTLEDVSENGYEVAMVTAVRKMIGDDGWRALTDCDYITTDQVSQIINAVTDKITGAMEKVGKSGN